MQQQANEVNSQLEAALQSQMINAEETDNEINQIEGQANQTFEQMGGRLNEMSQM